MQEMGLNHCPWVIHCLPSPQLRVLCLLDDKEPWAILLLLVEAVIVAEVEKFPFGRPRAQQIYILPTLHSYSQLLSLSQQSIPWSRIMNKNALEHCNITKTRINMYHGLSTGVNWPGNLRHFKASSAEPTFRDLLPFI